MKKSQIKKLDKLFSELIRSKGKCELSVFGLKCSGGLNCHHFVGRRNRAVRWYKNNAVCLCSLHHKLGKFSAHEHPAWFVEKMIKLRGQKWYDDLMEKARMIVKNQDYDELKKYLEE